MKKIFFLIALMISLNAATRLKAQDTSMWVAPYHPCYQWFDIPADDVPWDKITHLIIGYMFPEQTGDDWTIGLPPGWSLGEQSFEDNTMSFTSAGHSAGKKVCMMLGGEGSNPQGIWNNASSVTEVETFATNIRDVLTSLNCDGVDLDWEDSVDYEGLVRLAIKLREVWPDAIITIPTGCQGEDATELADAKDAVNAFMPMIYLNVQQWSGWLIPIPLTPLYGPIRMDGETNYGENPYSVNYALNNWINAGVPASKIVMGVGGFGDIWGDLSGDNRGPIAPYSCPSIWEGVEGETYSITGDNNITQSWLEDMVSDHPGELIESWDDIGKCSYWHTSAPNQHVIFNLWSTDYKVTLIFYESPRSMTEKVKFIKEKGMKGMMFWTLSQMVDSNGDFPNLEAITSPWSSIDSPEQAGTYDFTLGQNYPNPFNTSTTIHYEVLHSGNINLQVFDLSGREITTLVNEAQPSGSYTITWDGTNSQGIKIDNGLYYYQLQERTGTKKIKKMMLLY